MTTVKKFRRSTSKTSPEALATDIDSFATALVALLSGSIELPDIDLSGKVSRGNVRAWPASVKFTKADTNTFVPHELGFAASCWFPVGNSDYHRLRNGTVPPNLNGLWLQSDLGGKSDPITQKFIIYGVRAQ